MTEIKIETNTPSEDSIFNDINPEFDYFNNPSTEDQELNGAFNGDIEISSSLKQGVAELDNANERAKVKILRNIRKAAVNIMTTTALCGILLNACTNNPINASSQVDRDINKTQSPLVTPTATKIPTEGITTPTYTLESATVTLSPTPMEESTPTPTPIPEIDPEEFDYSMLDIMQWEGELTVSDKKRLSPGDIVEVKEGYHTVLYSTPLFNDYLQEKDNYSGIKIFDIPEGFKFELLETKKITAEDGRSITIGTVRNAAGESTLDIVSSIVLSAENGDEEIINFTRKSTEDIATASLISFTGLLHLKDQESGMLFLRNILEYQKNNGPFMANQTYSFREIGDMESAEFLRLFHYPDGGNITLDQSVGVLTNLLINENQIAYRTPSTVENGVAFGSLDTIWSDKETYGSRLKKSPYGGDEPENDIVLTFKKGPNGESSYYIYGDTMERGGLMYLSFYLSSKELAEEELQKNIERVDEIYQMCLEWERTNKRFTFGGEEGVLMYLYGSMTEEEIERLDYVIRTIYPLKSKDTFFK